MIVFELICAGKHRFEGWFASGEDFERQRDTGLLECPVCAEASIEKLPTAKIRRGNGVPDAAGAVPTAPRQPQQTAKRSKLAAVVEYILRNTEDVGKAFPEEARRIHYEETERRNIRGVASRQEAEELAEEGIPVLPLPVPPPGEVH